MSRDQQQFTLKLNPHYASVIDSYCPDFEWILESFLVKTRLQARILDIKETKEEEIERQNRAPEVINTNRAWKLYNNNRVWREIHGRGQHPNFVSIDTTIEKIIDLEKKRIKREVKEYKTLVLECWAEKYNRYERTPLVKALFTNNKKILR